MPLTVAANVIEQLAYGYRTELEELARAAGSQRPGWMLDRQPERLLFGDESEAADVGFGSTAVGQAARQQSFAGCARRGDTETQSRGLRNGRLRPISTAHDRSAPRADFGMCGWPSGCSALPLRRRYARTTASIAKLTAQVARCSMASTASNRLRRGRL